MSTGTNGARLIEEGRTLSLDHLYEPAEPEHAAGLGGAGASRHDELRRPARPDGRQNRTQRVRLGDPARIVA
jgi:hypothetical protein